MKTIYFILITSLLGFGCHSQPNIKSIDIFQNDTTYEVSTNQKGDTIDILTKINGIYNGYYRSYYDSKKLWHSSTYVDGKINGPAVILTEQGDTAIKENWRNGFLWERVIYWQPIPFTNDKKFYFLSDTGIVTIKDGRYIKDFINPPDGLIKKKFNDFYVYKKGAWELYTAVEDF